ncbi:MAG: THxN family PEP-CTERM protein [Rhodocyclaceae bacterium]
MNAWFSHLKKYGASAALLLLASGANAAVLQWNYSVSSIFTAATFTGGSASLPATSLSWGTPTGPGGQSSLTIGNNPAAGALSTYLGGGTPPQSPPFLATDISLTHKNEPIQGNSLTSAQLTSTITLTPLVPSLPSLPSQLAAFNILFTETPNQTPCAATSPAGNPCNDIFVLQSGLLNQMFQYDAGDGDGLLTYFVNIFPIAGGALNILSNAACAAAGAANGCIGFTTIEGQSNTLQFGFTISTQALTITRIPEPAMAALLSAALLAFAMVRRRRQ